MTDAKPDIRKVIDDYNSQAAERLKKLPISDPTVYGYRSLTEMAEAQKKRHPKPKWIDRIKNLFK